MYDKQRFLNDIGGQKKLIVQMLWDKKEVGYEGLMHYLVAERLTRLPYAYRGKSKRSIHWLKKIGFMTQVGDVLILNPSFVPRNQHE